MNLQTMPRWWSLLDYYFIFFGWSKRRIFFFFFWCVGSHKHAWTHEGRTFYEAIMQMLSDRGTDLLCPLLLMELHPWLVTLKMREGSSALLESSPPCPDSLPLRNPPDSFVCHSWRKVRSLITVVMTCEHIFERITCTTALLAMFISDRHQYNFWWVAPSHQCQVAQFWGHSESARNFSVGSKEPKI